MNRKLLIICGPTASGKTRLAFHLAKKFNGELVSADSRQLYRGMDVGTGKDLPKNSKTQKLKNSKLPGHYLIDGVRVWGYDLAASTQSFSVAQYINLARKIIKNIWERRKLPILVGGTGLYIKGVVDGIHTATIPRNEKLRKILEGKSKDELFEILAGVDPVKAASLNASDRKNPRRLVRAIEIARWKLEVGSEKLDDEVRGWKSIKMQTLFIGLTAPKKILDKRIEERTEERVKRGLLEEIRSLLSKGLNWDDQSMQTLGYRQWNPYLLGKVSKEEAVQKWITSEKNYAKRQMTWFKRDKRIKWFDVSKPSWKSDVENSVLRWHNKHSL